MPLDLVAILPRAPTPLSVPDAATTVESDNHVAVLMQARRWASLARRGVAAAAASRLACLEHLMPQDAILPALPGQRLTQQEAAEALRVNSGDLDEKLTGLRGLVQLQITLSFDTAQARERFRGAKDGPPLGCDDATLRRYWRDRLDAVLSPLSVDIVGLPIDGDMAANLVALLRREDLESMERAIVRFDELWPEGFAFRMIGPSPAVSFASIGFRRIGRAELRAARQLLGVGPTSDRREIRRALKESLRTNESVLPEVLRRAADDLQCAAGSGCPDGPVHRAIFWAEGRANVMGRIDGGVAR